MTKDEVIQRLSRENRAEIARATGLRYMYLSRIAWGQIKNPGSDQIDIDGVHADGRKVPVFRRGEWA